jgi:hypothetical protein
MTVMDNTGNIRAALGSAALVVSKAGKTVHTVESSITLFDEQGTLIYR